MPSADTLTRPDADVLERLDWMPRCEVEDCDKGHPAATHQVSCPCDCESALCCTVCADAFTVAIALWHRYPTASLCEDCSVLSPADRCPWEVRPL